MRRAGFDDLPRRFRCLSCNKPGGPQFAIIRCRWQFDIQSAEGRLVVGILQLATELGVHHDDVERHENEGQPIPDAG
jgi:hypothetical protein